MSLINLTGYEEQPRQIYVDLTKDNGTAVQATDVEGENPGGAETDAEITPEEQQHLQAVNDKVKTIVIDGPLGHVVTEVLKHYFSQEDTGTMMAVLKTPTLQREKEFDHYLYATDSKAVENSSMVELANRISAHVADADFKKVVISIEMNGGNISRAASFEEFMIAKGARVIHPRSTSAESITDRFIPIIRG